MFSKKPRHLIGSAVPRCGLRFDRSFDYFELEGRALASRRVLGYEVMDPIDGHKLYNELSRYCVNLAGKQYSLKGIVEALPDREAHSRFNSECDSFEIVITPQTLNLLQQGWGGWPHPRGASSIIHEWSHVELHAPLLQRLAQSNTAARYALHEGAGKPPHEFYFDTEWQAGALASAIQMPALAIKELQIRAGKPLLPGPVALRNQIGAIIQQQFRVSQEAAAYRSDIYESRSTRLLRRDTGLAKSIISIRVDPSDESTDGDENVTSPEQSGI